ncbi:ABC transporter permease [Bacillus andreraoultii]|uniref:ABC transporter permease n=1 Tax=Bacillus andreraoultii TaxID=1499685 RepID=UPI000539708E|nr:ABC transporter permease [Bacillus andreraoultii]
MINIIKTKFCLLFRKPLLFLGMIAMSVLFAYFLGNAQYTKVMIPVYSHINDIEKTTLWKDLSSSEIFEFTRVSESTARQKVREGDVGAAVELLNDNYKMIIAENTSDIPLLQNYLQSIYADRLIENNIEKQLQGENHKIEQIKQELKSIEKEPLFKVDVLTFRGNNSIIIDNQLQTLFGSALFFVIFTIAFNVLHILQEKSQGVWDRMILSPLRKWQIYTGNLFYSFLVGYLQVVLLFFVFRFVVGVNFYGGFSKTLIILIPYTFVIVSLAMFLVSVVKNVQHFNAIIPLVSVSMAMIGGAFWPLEIVSSKVLLKISEFIPITYGMEALKGATIYGASYGELMQPMSILLLMGVVLIGIGIHVMERK